MNNNTCTQLYTCVEQFLYILTPYPSRAVLSISV